MKDENKNWINLEEEDVDCTLRDTYIRASIMAGADTVTKLMGVTYLSQFENLEGEFSSKPIYTPDFHIGWIPFSSELIKLFNDTDLRLGFDQGGGKLEADDLNNRIVAFQNQGAQLFRLYQKNQENLARFKDDDKALFDRIRDCVKRDIDLMKNLTYLTRHAIDWGG